MGGGGAGAAVEFDFASVHAVRRGNVRMQQASEMRHGLTWSSMAGHDLAWSSLELTSDGDALWIPSESSAVVLLYEGL